MTVVTDDEDLPPVYCITEQISHHPPVSAYYYCCPEKGIVARGVDHFGAKFTGTGKRIIITFYYWVHKMPPNLIINLESFEITQLLTIWYANIVY